MDVMEPKNTTEAILLDYKKGIGTFTQKMPEIASYYNAFTESCFKAGVLSEREKQLIALGISIYNQDEYCMIYHTKGCIDQGCSEQEIFEVAGVAAAFGGGAAMSQAVTRIQEALEDFNQTKH
ncbi:carboxymuconolactone decarboxylase family protein [Bacillus kwashiorkori]|uniref:carboxymuconolactone decarboxylase family protein n=1 Tax=Bacillus kwashiorkori TaxID=1522318 RepID=UPI000781ED5B|nr:carboxymuconolactone decarboxylase family protein [Bacillus kwashiorkori]